MTKTSKQVSEAVFRRTVRRYAKRYGRERTLAVLRVADTFSCGTDHAILASAIESELAAIEGGAQ